MTHAILIQNAILIHVSNIFADTRFAIPPCSASHVTSQKNAQLMFVLMELVKKLVRSVLNALNIMIASLLIAWILIHADTLLEASKTGVSVTETPNALINVTKIT